MPFLNTNFLIGLGAIINNPAFRRLIKGLKAINVATYLTPHYALGAIIHQIHFCCPNFLINFIQLLRQI